MNIGETLLKESGLNYEDLNHVEREWIRAVNLGHSGYSMEMFKDELQQMKDSIALQLCDIPDDNEHRDQNSKLKARLKNYTVLHAKLNAPEMAEKALRRSLENKGAAKASPVTY